MELQLFSSATPDMETVPDKTILGGKGAGLLTMCQLGLPVPPGMTIPCEASIEYQTYNATAHKHMYLSGWVDIVMQHIDDLEQELGHKPLLSVRSGARVSMPGMMDTILNVGLTKDNLDHFRETMGDCAALDCYRRLLEMMGDVVFQFEGKWFANCRKALAQKVGSDVIADYAPEELEELIYLYESVYEEHNIKVPNDLENQLTVCVEAVWKSWNNDRAKAYREMHGYPDDWGTAVNIQTMVMGNLNDKSCSGVLFTRCPSTGIDHTVGEYLVNAQGEDVVAGTHTPENLDSLADFDYDVASQLEDLATKVESHYRDMQDMEFTVEDGKLWILQTRNGKRSSRAAFKIAHDLHAEGVITTDEMCQRVTVKDYLNIMQPSIDPGFNEPALATGIPAGGNVVSGPAVFNSKEAEKNPGCILIAKETNPDDIKGMAAAAGILTATGGATSHAAVVARGMNKTCVVGCTDIDLPSFAENGAKINGELVVSGDRVTLDGATGNIWVNTEVPVIEGQLTEEAETLVTLAVPQQATTFLTATNAALTNKVCLRLSDFSQPNMLAASIQALINVTEKQVVLLCESTEQRMGKGAFMLHTMCGEALDTEKEWTGMASFLEAMGKLLNGEHVVLKLGDDCPKNVRYTLGQQYNLVSMPTNVAELLNGEGPMVLTSEFVEGVIGGHTTLETLIAALKPGGVELFEEPKTIVALLDTVLG